MGELDGDVEEVVGRAQGGGADGDGDRGEDPDLRGVALQQAHLRVKI